jgi:hypothetical protein
MLSTDFRNLSTPSSLTRAKEKVGRKTKKMARAKAIERIVELFLVIAQNFTL